MDTISGTPSADLPFEPAADPDLVAEIHFTGVAGIIVNPSAALPAMLRMNGGDVINRGAVFYGIKYDSEPEFSMCFRS